MISVQLVSPYKGLVPFDETDLDALLFFGRERESEIIGANVLAARLTVLYGPSGVGKTSVLRAGVAHRLNAQSEANLEERGHPEFAVVVFAGWSDDPVAGIREAVRDVLSEHFGSALLDERDGESLADTLERWTDTLACDLLLILDQAEEYFLYHHGEGAFTDELPELVTRPGLRVRVLLAMRDDALSKLDRFKGRIPNLFGNYLRLDHLDRRAARDAIEKPVERFNELTGETVEVDPELVEQVLDETAPGKVDVGGSRGPTGGEVSEGRIEAPYLQLVLERVWDEERAAGSRRLTAATLARLGGADAIVRAHLRRAVEELSADERDLAADIFRHLVTPSGAKIAHGIGDLAEYASVEEQQLLPVLATLGRERIVRTVDGAGADSARYEIYHDVLGEAVLAWRREQELERERRAAERRHRRLAMVAIGALLALAAMTAVAIYAFSQRSDARRSAHAAQASERSTHARELGAVAQTDLATDPLQTVKLALAAAKLDPTPAAEDVLRAGLVESRTRRIFEAGRGPVHAASFSPDGALVLTASEDGTARIFRVRDGSRLATLHHGASVTDAEFSKDGQWVVTASRDKTARLWTRSGGPVRVFRHDAPVLDLALSPDAGTLVTLAADSTLHIWHLAGDQKPVVLTHVPGKRLALSRDGRRAAVVDGDRFARVYSIEGQRLLVELPHGGRVRSAEFGPSSEVLATGSADKLARVWTLRTFQVAYPLPGHVGQVVDVAIGPRGQFVATASLDGTGAIWKLGAPPGRLTATLTGHTNYLNDVSFSPDGLYVVTSSRDGTARVWKTKGGAPQSVLAGHKGSVFGASFSPNGRDVLTYAGDGTARIWDAGTEPELRPLGLGRHAAGKTLDLTKTLALTAEPDGTARVWNLRTGRSKTLRHAGPVNDAVFSPNGRYVVTASTDHTARVWTPSGTPKRTLAHPVPVASVDVNPSSTLIATGASDGKLRIWNLESGARIRTLDAGSRIDRVAFSPTGDRVAAATRNRLVRVWATDRWTAGPVLRGHRRRILSLAFSHDGRRLVTGGADATARVWNVKSGRQAQLYSHSAAVTSARFSPDDRLVATASADHGVRLWSLRTGRLLPPVLQAHFGAVSDVRFSDDGRWLVSAGPGAVGLWQVRTRRLVKLLRGRPLGLRGPTGKGSIGLLYAAGFTPGGYTIVTAGQDGAVRTYRCLICEGIAGLERLAAARLGEVAGPK